VFPFGAPWLAGRGLDTALKELIVPQRGHLISMTSKTRARASNFAQREQRTSCITQILLTGVIASPGSVDGVWSLWLGLQGLLRCRVAGAALTRVAGRST